MTPEQPWPVCKLLDKTTEFFQGKGVESARLEAQLLLAHVLSCSRTALYMRHDELVSDELRGAYRELVRERLKGKPVAHLLGKKEFFSLEFEVGPAVLVPRRDSEWLVTECLTLIKPMLDPRVLDVGTGSGCLAIAVAKQHKGAQVTAVDISPEALAVAGRNAERHKVQERVRLVESDLLSALGAEEMFDVILSNPPYISDAELAGLAVEVRDHEPRLALAGGADGLDVYRRLIAAVPGHVAAGGWLLLEIGATQEEAVRGLLEQGGMFELHRTILDGGGLPRVVKARRRA